MAALLDLPTELICLIAAFLSPLDLGSLRESCRDLDKKSRNVFVRFFQVRHVFFERRSMGALTAISRHKILGPIVRAVGIGTEFLPRVYVDDELLERRDSILEGAAVHYLGNEDSSWFCDDKGEEDLKVVTYREKFQDQQDFIRMEYLNCLRRAMSGLPNCRKLILTDTKNPWGVCRLIREVGSKYRRGFNPSDPESVHHVQRILEAMFLAAASPELLIEELDIYLGHIDEPASRSSIDLKMLVDRIPLVHSSAPWRLRRLTSLRLVVSPVYSPEQNAYLESTVGPFFELFPRLSHLALSFGGNQPLPPGNGRLFQILSKRINIPNLRVLELSYLSTKSRELVELLQRHDSTLEVVKLDRVIMGGMKGWESLLRTINVMSRVRDLTVANCPLQCVVTTASVTIELLRQSLVHRSLASFTSFRLLVRSSNNPQVAMWHTSLARFLKTFPRLSRLQLIFKHAFIHDQAVHYFSHVQQLGHSSDHDDLDDFDPPGPSISESQSLLTYLTIHQLRDLLIGSLNTTSSELEGFLLRHGSTLENIVLQNVTFSGRHQIQQNVEFSTQRDNSAFDNACDGEAGAWASLLRTIMNMDRIRCLTLENCRCCDNASFGEMLDRLPKKIRIASREMFTEVIARFEHAAR
ncbi:hypothetical protein QQS21_006703 [Conoideocrella luteorostrata]|uniref:F-box domain-containing protein n=1 Tax=Conoideocrella luteorostrata TaxID=1105319 RepID=A0AAJ0CM48_9HYPO|nr:hypothetical protein QQS21_006703 [Conoideocrella luteorostrata]